MNASPPDLVFYEARLRATCPAPRTLRVEAQRVVFGDRFAPNGLCFLERIHPRVWTLETHPSSVLVDPAQRVAARFRRSMAITSRFEIIDALVPTRVWTRTWSETISLRDAPGGRVAVDPGHPVAMSVDPFTMSTFADEPSFATEPFEILVRLEATCRRIVTVADALALTQQHFAR